MKNIAIMKNITSGSKSQFVNRKPLARRSQSKIVNPKSLFVAIFTLLMVFFAPWTSAATVTLLSENFNSSSLPTDWSYTSSNWSISNSSYANGSAYEVNLNWSPRITDNITRLITPACNLTGINSVTFSFKHYLDYYSSTYTTILGIATSSDGGNTWNTGWSNTYTTDVSATTVSQIITTTDMGKANVLFCIYFEGDSYGFDDWYFDDINITAEITTPTVTLSPTSATVLTGFTETLTASTFNVTGTPSISYSSNNTNVATVSGSGTSATVTAVAPGSATITATMTYQGNNYTSTCAITVEDPSYCEPSFSSPSDDYISNFATSGGTTNINNTSTYVSGGYSDYYNNYSVSIEAGATLTCTVTSSSTQWNYGHAIWVDWNKDYEFTSEERVAYTSSTATGNWTGSFVVPANIAAGDYRMRVIHLYNNTPTNPCMSDSYGEAEDYKLTVLSVACPKPTNLSLTASGNTVTATWSGTASSYNIDINGVVDYDVTSPHTFTGNLATTYTIKIQADCGTDGTSDWTASQSVTTDLCLAENMCEIKYRLIDDGGDGWDGNAINVVDDATGLVLATLTVDDGAYTIGTLAICDDRDISFEWVSGSNASETSYTVIDAWGEVIFSGSDAMTSPFNYTMQCPSCHTPSNPALTNITTSTVSVGWGPDGNYQVRYRPVQDPILFEDFESGLPGTWTIVDSDGDGYEWYESNNNAHSGTGCVASNSYVNYVGSVTPDNWLISPQVQLGGYVSFWAVGQDPNWPLEHFAIYVSTTGTDPSNFTQISEEFLAYDEYTRYTADLSSYSGMGYIAIRHFNVTNMFVLNIDDFGVYANVPWSELSTTQPSVDLANLTATTEYELQVRKDCDGEYSFWSEALVFTTPCNVNAGFPWSEDFEGLSTDYTIPDCWDNKESTCLTSTYKWSYENSMTNGTGHNGSKCIRYDSYNSSGQTNMLKTPLLDLETVPIATLKFWYKNDYGGDFSVYVSTNGGITYTNTLATGLNSSSWTECTYDLTPYCGHNNVVIVFKGTSNASGYIYLDDVSVTAPVTHITSTADWDEFCSWVNSGYNYNNETVYLDEDITISTMAGTVNGSELAANSFSGTFDGGEHTLNVNISNDGHQAQAPFRCINGATIKDLKVVGSVTSTRHHASGLVGYVNGTGNTILNCHVSTNVTNPNTTDTDPHNNNNYMGGLIGHNMASTTTIEGCVYDGTLTSQGFKGAMIGFANAGGSIIIKNSYCGGNYSTPELGDCNFSPLGVRSSNASQTLTISNFYYKNDAVNFYRNNNSYQITSNDAKHGYTVTGATDDVTVEMRGTPTDTYSVSRITAYNPGIVYDGHIYGGDGENLALDLGYTGTAPVIGYESIPADLLTHVSGDDYTLAMPAENVIIRPKLCSMDNSSNYTYIWRGVSAEWSTAANWYVNDGNYTLASSLPEDAKYYIGKWNEDDDVCVPANWPSLSGTVSVGDIKIAEGAELTVSSGNTLKISGNLDNDVIWSAEGTVIFNGNSNQTISNDVTFKYVEFAQTGDGLSISGNITIDGNDGTATFSKGIVNGNVVFGSSASAINASTNSYVNGKVTKNGMASSFCFPTGTASLYAPFEATSSSASNVSVQYASGHTDMPDWWNHSGNLDAVGLSHASDRENWQISASATTNLSSIKLYWNAGGDHSFEEGNAALSSYLNVAAVQANGFRWQNLGRASVSGNWNGSGSITASNPLEITVGAKAAGDGDYFITFASSNKGGLLLPIELLSFTATCNGKYAELEWSTASERNNDYFVIERSEDAKDFVEVGRVAGAGNSIEQLDYTYNDYGIHGGDNYYRLVQVDYDGTRTVSEVIVANCIEPEVGEPDVQAYPNPFNGELTLVLDNFSNRAAIIEVYDMLGKLIYTEKASAPQNSYETILNLSNLPSGAYTVRVSTTDFVINKNVVKQ